jgi:hypothetical protein
VVDVTGKKWKFEALRHHTNYHVGPAVQQKFLAQDIWITMEAVLPHGEADHHNRLILLILLPREEATPERLDRECRKNTGAHPCRTYFRWIPNAGEIKFDPLIAS